MRSIEGFTCSIRPGREGRVDEGGGVIAAVLGRGSFVRGRGADQRRRQHDEREGHRKGEDRDEGASGDDPVLRGLERAPRDAQQGLDHDGDDGGADAVEHAFHQRHARIEGVDGAQRQHQERAGQDEQQPARDEAAAQPRR